jgi:ABC-type sugar transport system ATPase subunit
MDIKFVDVSKSYGEIQAAKELNLSIEDGSFVVILGPSGSGKSTILNMVAGLDRPDRGDIYGGGVRLNDLGPRERNVAMVFQSYALYPHLNVFRNIAFPLSVRGVRRESQEEKVREAASALHIESLLDRRIRDLSGGEAQRVALARAMVREPAAFLMDEPLSNLDAKLRVMMRAEMQRLHRRLGTTILYVTHDQEEALAIGDAVAILNHGKLQQYGTPDEIFERPANVFVASFIGSPEINLFGGNLERVVGELKFRGKGISIGIPESLAARWGQFVREEHTIVLGARPESLRIVGADTSGAFAGTVDVVERIGRDLHAHVNVDGNDVRVVVSADTHLRAKEAIWLTLDPVGIHVFDAESNTRLA